ncbi:hypothetical protein L0Z42_22625 [Burkholderia multivorans]|uniref:hypothetical protein n=1 Tax=Burkholderia multivorans TaxID=87883 RepID=UPI00201862A7|nr:hypothetical protein [Burkholderia multivorans]MCO1373299.1 hypothetical protein [Burkholderia multivorans]MCO1455441.1 hypothetical protein [Burkholderia multivorans]MCO1469994.1 hypothetical protein [Burkholderia multivorans]UQO20362.1 hypothetical protein L0Z02_19990 [Burkholderia multivorans]UQO83453.1 hypothetical protein L0Y86_03760 [Burkholderia multivorans]
MASPSGKSMRLRRVSRRSSRTSISRCTQACAPYQGSDAVLFVRVGTGYVSPGRYHAYTRRAIGNIVMFKSDTYEAILSQHVNWKQSDDAYRYASVDALGSDLQHAIDGLEEGLMAQVDPFDKLFDAPQR